MVHQQHEVLQGDGGRRKDTIAIAGLKSVMIETSGRRTLASKVYINNPLEA